MKKNILVVIALLLLNNCGKLEFVYKIEENILFLNKKTLVNVSGDDADLIQGFLNGKIGNTEDDEPEYKLIVNSSKKITAEVIEKDATASKFRTRYTISYYLFNLSEKCDILDKKITTVGVFNAKSAGYSFGTDFSKKESSKQSINKNLNEFMTSLHQVTLIDGCGN